MTTSSTVEENTNLQHLKLSKLEQEIARFDAVLDRIQKVFADDVKVWDRANEARDAVFKLQQQLRGCDIEVFASPWIDPEDTGFPYESPADIFWNSREEDVEYYAEGEDPTKREKEV